jgi:DNA-directed RNA polymerase subunit RPC12/RpoP
MERGAASRVGQDLAPAHRRSPFNPALGRRGRQTARYDELMPALVCSACGKRVYTTAKLDSLFGEERRCPRCGADLRAERREVERRDALRRQNAPQEPGPPAEERRVEDRRKGRPRRTAGGDAKKRSDLGWSD